MCLSVGSSLPHSNLAARLFTRYSLRDHAARRADVTTVSFLDEKRVVVAAAAAATKIFRTSGEISCKIYAREKQQHDRLTTSWSE